MVSVKHKFVNAHPDGPDASVVRPSNWNDDHDITGLGTAAGLDVDTDGTLAANSDALVATQKAVKTYVDAKAGIASVVDDTTPQLGGDLDLNGHKIPGIDYGDLANTPTLGTAASHAATDFATAAQGALADSAVQPSDLVNYPTRADIAAATIPAPILYITTSGYAAAGDGGRALYKRVGSAPSHSGKVQSTDGAWWELAELTVNPYQFGATEDDGTTNTSNDMTAVFQAMIDFVAAKNAQGIIPAAKFYIAGNLRTSNATQPDYITSAYNSPRISGMGRKSTLRGPGAAAATYSTTLSMGAQAVISIYRSGCIFENFQIQQAKVAFFIGQDPDDTAHPSKPCYNTVQNIWLEDVGTGLLMQPGVNGSPVGGVYYNRFYNWLITDCQIGVHLAPWVGGTSTVGNNNRNTFVGFRVQRGWGAYLIESGDGNDFISCFAENMLYATDGGNFVGSSPTIISSWAGANTALAWNFVDIAASNNRIVGGGIESTDKHITDSGYKNSVFNHYCDKTLCNFTSSHPEYRSSRFIPGEINLDAGATFIAGTSKSTPVDADTVPLVDSAASSVLKTLSWANVKATLKTYFDTLYGPSPIVFRARLAGGDQTITANTSTDITIDTEVLDPQNIHNLGEVTPGFAGVFNFRSHIWIKSGLTSGTACYFELWSKPNAGGTYALAVQVPFLPTSTGGTFDFNEFVTVTSTAVYKMRLYLQGTGDKVIATSYTSISGIRVS